MVSLENGTLLHHRMGGSSMMSEKMLTLRITESAVAWYQAEQSVRQLKALYNSVLTEYFHEHGRPEGRFDPDDPEFAGAVAHTSNAYAMLSDAKREFYNAKRRHQRAITALIKFNK